MEILVYLNVFMTPLNLMSILYKWFEFIQMVSSPNWTRFSPS